VPRPPALRAADPADRPALLALFAAANEASGGRYAPTVHSGELDIGAWFDRKRLDRAWVLADADGLVGYVGVRADPAPAEGWGLPAGRPWLEVARLCVHPHAQRRGCARALMARVEPVLAARAGWLTCHRDSPGQRLYESLGWSTTDLPISWPDDPTPGVLLTRTPLVPGPGG
jgi:GNAT superfamily N-acetyltransferase